MAIPPFIAAINQISAEKGLSREVILETVEAALAAAYRKDYGKPGQVIKAKVDPETGKIKVWRVFEVVKGAKDIEDETTQMALAEAKKIKKNIKAGEKVEKPLPEKAEFGRIAAQTAKQVIIQKIREAERDIIYKEFKEKEHQLLNGIVQQIEGRNVVIDLNKTTGLILPSDQIPTERYFVGQRLKVYLKSVEETSRGPQILLSRSAPELIGELFANEVPEIATGDIEVVGVAREAGARSKIAVKSNKKELDPVGSAVGQRGTRVQAVLSEIGDEKIDIILYSDDPEELIINALSPAKVTKIKLNKKAKKAVVEVPDEELSLAIGRGGQNVRLAGELSGWEIDILKKDKVFKKAKEERVKGEGEQKKEKTEAKEEAKEAESPERSRRKKAEEKKEEKETKEKPKNLNG